MAARYLLDTDICIYAIAGRSESVLRRFDRLKPHEAQISLVAYAELLFGAAGSRDPAAAQDRLHALTSIARVADLPTAAAERYADIRLTLERKGQPIGNNDLWIAAHASAAGLTLVTNNEREFRRVPGLKLENWAR